MILEWSQSVGFLVMRLAVPHHDERLIVIVVVCLNPRFLAADPLTLRRLHQDASPKCSRDCHMRPPAPLISQSPVPRDPRGIRDPVRERPTFTVVSTNRFQIRGTMGRNVGLCAGFALAEMAVGHHVVLVKLRVRLRLSTLETGFHRPILIC
jgi:hypothetical protein